MYTTPPSTGQPNAEKIYDDVRFGALLLVPGMNSYTGTANWQGTVVDLHLSLDDAQSLQQVLPVAHALWHDGPAWDARLRARSIARLLELKNNSWLEEDELPLSASDFSARMTLLSVTFHAGGSFDFLYHDGDLFWGHAIELSGSLEDGVTHAEIVG